MLRLLGSRGQGRNVSPSKQQLDGPVRARRMRLRSEASVEEGPSSSFRITSAICATRVGSGPKGRGFKPRSRTVCNSGSPWTADQAWGLVVGFALVAVWFLSTKVDKLVADAQRRQLKLDAKKKDKTGEDETTQS